MSGPDLPSLPPRLAPDAAFPPYSYVTGRFPHPTRDPAGHSFGHSPAVPPPLEPTEWSQSHDYLLGCDLFNYGYYWEAHETWEGLWHACGRSGTTADVLKGLIKLAAAGVKCREGRTKGVVRHAARAGELFEYVRRQIAGSRYLGLDLDWLIEMARQLTQQPPAHRTVDAAVERVFCFQLLPEEANPTAT